MQVDSPCSRSDDSSTRLVILNHMPSSLYFPQYQIFSRCQPARKEHGAVGSSSSSSVRSGDVAVGEDLHSVPEVARNGDHRSCELYCLRLGISWKNVFRASATRNVPAQFVPTVWRIRLRKDLQDFSQTNRQLLITIVWAQDKERSKLPYYSAHERRPSGRMTLLVCSLQNRLRGLRRHPDLTRYCLESDFVQPCV